MYAASPTAPEPKMHHKRQKRMMWQLTLNSGIHETPVRAKEVGSVGRNSSIFTLDGD